MAVYTHFPAGGNRRVVCLTGRQAFIFITAGTVASVSIGAVLGGLIGHLITILWPELVVRAVAIGVGILIGALLGLALSAVFIAKSMCPCPAGRYGLCFEIRFITAFGRIIPTSVRPAAGFCSIISAGCP